MPDSGDVAKILLTSGSTGLPKAVPYPHRLMTTAMTMTLQVWPFAVEEPPVLLDWLPWNHAFGGTANLHLVLACGGTLHIDEGGPTAEGLALTLADVPRLRPNMFFAVPATLDLLRARLESNHAQALEFFSSVRVVFSAGAALSADTFHALRSLSEDCGNPVAILSGWGSTETGPGASMLHIADAGPGWIGTPLPGVDIKLNPEGSKYHACVRGPNVFPGYWGATDDKAVFDSEGYYRTGDAACLVDPDRPELGLRFDGRLADDFKLSNGTWVDYARVRADLLTLLNGSVVDLVIGIPDSPCLVALAWTADGEPLAPTLVEEVLKRYNAQVARPSDQVRALGTLVDPPSAREVSPKGQLRSAEVRRSRKAEFLSLLNDNMDRTSA
jgi:feruloyl-CoA synthase